MKRNGFLLKVICLTLILATLAGLIACDNGGVGESEKGSTPEINENNSPDENIDDDKNGEDDNRNAVKVYYNDDGTVDYEEHYDDNGVLSKKIEYYGDASFIYHTETFFDANEKKIKEVSLYGNNYTVVSEFDENEDTIKSTVYNENETINAYTVFGYDDNRNMIEETVYDGNDVVTKHFDFEYNEHGALIKETRKYGVKGSIKIYEYDPENSQEKHKHWFAISFSEGIFTGQYEMDVDEIGTSRLNYGRIISYIYYRADGSVSGKYIREYDANNDYVIRYTSYAEDGSVRAEQIFDKEGNMIERIYP